MNIVLDGPSGVGKSFLGRQLAQRLNMDFVDMEIDRSKEISESELHMNILNNMSVRKLSVIENSYIQSTIIKQFMTATGKLPLLEYFRILANNRQVVPKIQPWIQIIILDDKEVINKRRTLRGNPWEYSPETDLSELTNYLETSLVHISNSSSNLKIVHIRNKYNSVDEELNHLIKRLRNMMIV